MKPNTNSVPAKNQPTGSITITSTSSGSPLTGLYVNSPVILDPFAPAWSISSRYSSSVQQANNGYIMMNFQYSDYSDESDFINAYEHYVELCSCNDDIYNEWMRLNEDGSLSMYNEIEFRGKLLSDPDFEEAWAMGCTEEIPFEKRKELLIDDFMQRYVGTNVTPRLSTYLALNANIQSNDDIDITYAMHLIPKIKIKQDEQ